MVAVPRRGQQSRTTKEQVATTSRCFVVGCCNYIDKNAEQRTNNAEQGTNNNTRNKSIKLRKTHEECEIMNRTYIVEDNAKSCGTVACLVLVLFSGSIPSPGGRRPAACVRADHKLLLSFVFHVIFI